MRDQFLTVLTMSLTGSYIILVVLLARLVLRKAPKIFSYVLWAVVLFRLLCPFTFESPVSVVPSADLLTVPGRGETTAQVVHIQTGILALNRPVNDFLAQHPYQGLPADDPAGDLDVAPVLPQTGGAADWRTVPTAIWLVGIAALLGYSGLSLLRLRRKLTGTLPLEGEKGVLLADHIPSPFVLGVLRPKIYLPSGLPEGERDYVLLHERTHIRRGDHIFRALAWLAVAVHWFNPLAWLAFHLAGKDMEMSCDEAVLGQMGRDVRADYSTSLLRLSTGARLPAGPLAFGAGDPKSRIKNVLRYQKPALWAIVLALAGVVCAGAALATDRGGSIDLSSVTRVTSYTSASFSQSDHGTIGYGPVDRWNDLNDPKNPVELPQKYADELVDLINSYGKSVKGHGEIALSGVGHQLMRMDCADGSFYLLDYWYTSGFSFNPLHFGEDDYDTLITYYDAEGNAGTTWQMAYEFDLAYRDWFRSIQWNAVELWLDYKTTPADMPGSAEIELPEFPGVTFRWTPGAVSAVNGAEEMTELFGGMPIWCVCLADLNGDGKRELCAEVSFGSGLIDQHLAVCDYASGQLYELWDRGVYDYSLRLEEGQLWAVEQEYPNGRVLRAGPLVMTESGLDIQAIEAPSASGWISLPNADLTFSLEGDDDGPFVRMEGSVGGVPLRRNAIWYPQGMETLFGGQPGGVCLSWEFSDGWAEVTAWWADDSHTSITLSTQMSASLSSVFNTGWWEVTVDLTTGSVTEIIAHPLWAEGLNDETHMYPVSISDEDAVTALQAAAKLLTAAEDYYNNAAGVRDAQDEPADQSPPNFRIPETDGGRVLIEGLGQAYVEWNAGGSLYFEHDTSFFLPTRMNGYEISGYASWVDEAHSVLFVSLEWTDADSLTQFTVDINGTAVIPTYTQAANEEDLLELTDDEMQNTASLMSSLMIMAEEYYNTAEPAPTE